MSFSKNCGTLKNTEVYKKFESCWLSIPAVAEFLMLTSGLLEGERKKEEEEESYPHVSPPEEDLLDQLSFRWIILVKIIRGYSRMIEDICNG